MYVIVKEEVTEIEITINDGKKEEKKSKKEKEEKENKDKHKFFQKGIQTQNINKDLKDNET